MVFFREHVVVILLYLALSIVLTFPLILNIGSTYQYYYPIFLTKDKEVNRNMSVAGTDTIIEIWLYWFFHKSVLEFKSPLNTDLFFGSKNFPMIANLTWFNPIISLAPQIFLSPVASLNLITLLTFTLNGLATYFLVRRELKVSQVPALISGIYLMSSSYVYVRSQEHIALANLYLLIIFLLLIFTAFRKDSLKHFIFAALFLFLAGLVTWYYLFYGLIISGLIFAFAYPNRIRGYLIFAVCTLIFFLPFGLEFVSSTRGQVGATYQNSTHFSSDVISLFVPLPSSSLWGKLTFPIYEGIFAKSASFIERETSFIGILGIFSAAFYLIKGKGNKRPWMIVFFAGAILSLGPYLTFSTRSIIPLPYLILSPMLPFMQNPSRFIVFSIIAVAVFLGYTLEYILGNLKLNGIKKCLLLVFVSLYLLLENAHWPYTLAAFNFSNDFYDGLRKKSNKIVLNVPALRFAGGDILYLPHQVLFNQKMINGYSTFVSAPMVANTPYASDILNPLDCFEATEIPSNYSGQFLEYTKTNNINYLILHKRISELEGCEQVKKNVLFLKEMGTIGESVFEDNNITAYKINRN